ncbi:LysE family transporter [Candidatus Nitrosotenuis sp. DW1]|uniref:LysE family transporter n=1 Tax=Candidatus Nitrosotenuis sp. DW1 TaxID=2259672 RepID=UPI0015CBE54A|nr:LysE family transporter [Candidatus Nitrosotenuis sp. DW1]QLH08709.1 lysine transporter LysE [Candidatus Nitrosotenuis sp. DW1]
MQDFFQFGIAVVIISASGVMSPGPLFVATIANGIRQGARAGFRIAFGHTLVELPLVVSIGLGILSLDAMPQFRVSIGILGALSIFGFAGLQIISTLRKDPMQYKSKYGSFLTGILLTGLNPFFLIWWFTIGFKLISDALLLWSIWGILIMFALHIWMDYAWLVLVSFLSSRGKVFLSNKRYKIGMIGINAVLIYFGITFILQAKI